MHRKFISNFLIFKTDNDRMLYNRIYNGNVLVIDDFVREGTTFKELYRLINTYLPNSITFYALFS